MFPLGGGTVPAWKLLTRTTQGAAPSDPGAFTGSGTSFNSTTGLFTWVMAGDVTRVDGYREQMARWTIPLLTLYPNFDATKDCIDLAMQPIAIPGLTGVERYGLAFGLLDSETLATANGRLHALWMVGATYNSGQLATTSATPTDGETGDVQSLAVARFSMIGEAAELDSGWRIRNTLGAWSDGPRSSPTACGTGLCIVVGHIHVATTSGTPTMQCKIWHRRLRTTGNLVGLP